MSTNSDRTNAFELVLNTVERLRSFDQKDMMRELANEAANISDNLERKAFVDAVYNLLDNSGDTESRSASSHITLDRIVACSSIVAFISLFFGIKLPLVWAFLVSFIIGLALFFLMKLFDRKSFFRRLFAIWCLNGFGLFATPTIALFITNEFLTFEWGGPPSSGLVMAWVIGLLTIGCGAILEARNHGWS